MIAPRALAVVLALLAALGTAPAMAQEPRGNGAQTVTARDLRFALVPGDAGSATVTVRHGARELLRLERSSGAFDPEQDRRWVFLADADFDGYPDLWVLEMAGMVNTSYSLELFDPGTRSFVAVPEFAALSNPRVDRRSRRITTFERDGCCAHTEASWRWDAGRLETVAQWGDAALPGEAGAVCFVRLWRRERQDGAMVDRPDRIVPLHVFNRESQAPACRNARPPGGGAR